LGKIGVVRQLADERLMDPLTQLVFAISSSPGVYALLLGSGVSSGAGIPTGWAIVEDLARRLAGLEFPGFSGHTVGVGCGPLRTPQG
jgi:hypothetical protein